MKTSGVESCKRNGKRDKEERYDDKYLLELNKLYDLYIGSDPNNIMIESEKLRTVKDGKLYAIRELSKICQKITDSDNGSIIKLLNN